MKRPTDEQRHAAWLLGFPQYAEPQLLNGTFVPGRYANTVDRVTEQRFYPIFALFVFMSFSYLPWTVGVLRFIWIGAVIETMFSLLLLAMLYIGIRAICRSSSRKHSQVSVGLNGMTLIFKSGKTLYLDFYGLEAIFTIFRASLGDDGKKLKRGLFQINTGPMYSVNPNIVIAIREAYRTIRDTIRPSILRAGRGNEVKIFLHACAFKVA